MHISLGRARRGMAHLDADLVDGIAMRSSAGCERVTHAVEGLTLDAEAAQDTSEVRTVRSPIVRVRRKCGLKGGIPTGWSRDRSRSSILSGSRKLGQAECWLWAFHGLGSFSGRGLTLQVARILGDHRTS